MSLGPVELIVLKYYGDHFTGIPAALIQSYVDTGLIRIIDGLLARKGVDGEVSIYEISEVKDAESGDLNPVVSAVTDLLNHDDVRALSADWAPRTTGVVLLFEHLWARGFRDAVAEAGGEVVLVERVPRAVIEELEQSREPQPIG
jgi:hypothetical protein